MAFVDIARRFRESSQSVPLAASDPDDALGFSSRNHGADAENDREAKSDG